jgi:hypothetical protein
MENVHQSQFRLRPQIRAMAGTVVLTKDSPTMQILDPGAARNLDLPAEADSKGLVFIIKNTGAATELITVRDDAAATVIVIDVDEGGIVYCDGVTWHGGVWTET